MIELHTRLDRLTQTAKELSEATGRSCIPAQADVRHPKALQDAVAKAIETFGRIDFVICGKSSLGERTTSSCFSASAGSFTFFGIYFHRGGWKLHGSNLKTFRERV